MLMMLNEPLRKKKPVLKKINEVIILLRLGRKYSSRA